MKSPGLMLCRVGWHKALVNGTWNQGYCFTTCSRCGRDMVRSLFGEWLVPADFRVVWHAKEEAGNSAAATAQGAVQPVASRDPTAEAGQSPFDFAEFDVPSPDHRWVDRAKRRKM